MTRLYIAFASVALLLTGCLGDATRQQKFFGNLPISGVLVVQKAPDYSSVSFSLLDSEGMITTQDFLNSGSETPALSTAFAGDTGVPGSPTLDGRLVFIDRFNSVITWVDSQSLAVRKQLSVGEPSYGDNPFDYLEVSADKAYVSRYGLTFAEDGSLSSGDDLLVVNPGSGTAVKRIPLSDQAAPAPDTSATTYARPSRLVDVDGFVYVVQQNMTAGFLAGPSSLTIVDPQSDAVVTSLEISTLDNCGGAVYNKPKSELVLVCSGNFAKGSDDQFARSGIAIVDVSDPAAPSHKSTIAASSFATGPLGTSIGLVTDEKVLVISQGETDFATGDVLRDEEVFLVDLVTPAQTRSVYSVEGAFQLDVFADPANLRVYIADAAVEAPVLKVYESDANDGTLTPLRDLTFANGFPVRGMTIY